MALYTYDHIHLLSQEPMDTAKYFNEMFGARIVESVQSDGNPKVDLDLNGLEIFIARCAADTTPSADHPHQGLDHFGLRVENSGRRGCGAEGQGRGVHLGAARNPSGGHDRLRRRARKHPHRAAGEGPEPRGVIAAKR